MPEISTGPLPPIEPAIMEQSAYFRSPYASSGLAVWLFGDWEGERMVRAFYGDAAYNAIREHEAFERMRQDMKRRGAFVDEVASQVTY